MALPRIVVRGKEIILLSGFKDEAKETNESVCGVVVDDEVKLQQAAKRNPDAVHGLQHCRDETERSCRPRLPGSCSNPERAQRLAAMNAKPGHASYHLESQVDLQIAGDSI